MSDLVHTAPPPTATKHDPAASRELTAMDIVDEWGRGSFPASDPPANW